MKNKCWFCINSQFWFYNSLVCVLPQIEDTKFYVFDFFEPGFAGCEDSDDVGCLNYDFQDYRIALIINVRLPYVILME